MIEVENLDFDYGGPKILRNMSLKLPHSSLLLIVGENGAGGKALFNGKAEVEGQNTFYNPPAGISYLGTEWITNSATKLDIEVRELLNSLRCGLYKERTDELLKLLEINLDWHMNAISDGQRRRVQILMGLYKPFQVLLLDEITMDLDVIIRKRLFDYLKGESVERKASVLYATHIFDNLSEWATHIAHIHQGSIKHFYPLSSSILSQTSGEDAGQFDDLKAVLRDCEERFNKGLMPESPLLMLVEKWLLEDRQKLVSRTDGENEETLWTKLDYPKLKGDKYYNYWK